MSRANNLAMTGIYLPIHIRTTRFHLLQDPQDQHLLIQSSVILITTTFSSVDPRE